MSETRRGRVGFGLGINPIWTDPWTSLPLTTISTTTMFNCHNHRNPSLTFSSSFPPSRNLKNSQNPITHLHLSPATSPLPPPLLANRKYTYNNDPKTQTKIFLLIPKPTNLLENPPPPKKKRKKKRKIKEK